MIAEAVDWQSASSLSLQFDPKIPTYGMRSQTDGTRSASLAMAYTQITGQDVVHNPRLPSTGGALC